MKYLQFFLAVPNQTQDDLVKISWQPINSQFQELSGSSPHVVSHFKYTVVSHFKYMATHGEGWTLVYSYTFTNYRSFKLRRNAVTPRPKWHAPKASVPVSTTPPLCESLLGAVDWKLWKDIGQEFMVKSTINDWIVCQPNDGSIVEERAGSINCENINSVAQSL